VRVYIERIDQASHQRGSMRTQEEKGTLFRALHDRNAAFIIPNPWDIGTARLLATLGFEALATTSAGYAFSLGRRDNTVGRDRMIAHIRDIVSATDLPVSADLENGFGDDPETAAEILLTQSNGCKRTRRLEPMCSTLPALQAKKTSPQS
jgi:2-methylisocitrate lyase-like PEP mutase family enzyme